MTMTNEQAREVLRAMLDYRCMYASQTETHLEQNAALDLAIAALGGGEVGDIFWDLENSEQSYYHISDAVTDAIDNDAENGAVLVLTQAKRLPAIRVRITNAAAYEYEVLPTSPQGETK